MYTTTFLFSLLLTPTLNFAAPAPDAQPKAALSTDFVFNDYFGSLDNAGHKLSKRSNVQNFDFQDYSGSLDVSDHKVANAEPGARVHVPQTKQKRHDGSHISSCGHEWVPVNDFQTYTNRSYIGYETAVHAFCAHITKDAKGYPTIVGARAYAGTTIGKDMKGRSVGLNKGVNPHKHGAPGVIEFEIHNKRWTGQHIPDLQNCKFYLMQMANPGSKCRRRFHDDTKGGTWQIGHHEISYHALPKHAS